MTTSCTKLGFSLQNHVSINMIVLKTPQGSWFCYKLIHTASLLEFAFMNFWAIGHIRGIHKVMCVHVHLQSCCCMSTSNNRIWACKWIGLPSPKFLEYNVHNWGRGVGLPMEKFWIELKFTWLLGWIQEGHASERVDEENSHVFLFYACHNWPFNVLTHSLLF